MATYLLRRLLLFVPTLLGATFLIFMIMAASPGSIVDALLPPGGELRPGERAVKEEYLEERYGLGSPYVNQYLRWLNNISPIGFDTWKREDETVKVAKAEQETARNALRADLAATGLGRRQIDVEVRTIDPGPDAGDPRLNMPRIKQPDLGQSFIQARRVWPIIAEALPVTITLQVVALPLAIVISIITGVQAARFRGKTQDVGIGTLLLALYAMPVIWIGVMLIGFLANVNFVPLFPAAELNDLRAPEMSFFPTFSNGFQRGYLLDSAWHLVLPVFCIAYPTVAYYSKLTRTSLLESLGTDYVRTARAKGLPESTVTYRHAFRTSLIPLITVAASFLPLLVAGSIVVETIFSINGMGRLAIEALKRNDRELFLSVSVIILMLQLVGYLLADIAYVIADPRVSYE